MYTKKRLIIISIFLLIYFCIQYSNVKSYYFPATLQPEKNYILYKSDSGCGRIDKDCSLIDKEYKNEIIKKSGIQGLSLEDLSPVMGPCEIEKFIRENDGNPKIYTPTEKNLQKGIYRANLHTHSTASDGCLPFLSRLDEAQQYAKKHNTIFYIATTDHNTINAAKDTVLALKRNPGKYDKVKIILGIEINSIYNLKKADKDKVDIHVLAWGINPYDEYLNEEFYKPETAGTYNRPRKNPEFEDFDNVIRIINNCAIVGVAHPARYISQLEDKKYDYLQEMLLRYKSLTPKDKPMFVEGYYQAYNKKVKYELGDEYKDILNFINIEAKKLGIIRTGSMDTHGMSILEN